MAESQKGKAGIMRVEKEKRKVALVCDQWLLVRGYVHINPGERIIDFFNDSRESFIAVTDAEYYGPQARLFQLFGRKLKKSVVIINKSAIKVIDEV